MINVTIRVFPPLKPSNSPSTQGQRQATNCICQQPLDIQKLTPYPTMDNPKPRKFVLKVPLDYRRQEAVHEPSHKADSVDTADQDIQDLLDDDDHEDDAGVSHPSSPIAVESTASVLKSQPPSPLATPRGSSVARDPDDLGTPKRPSKRPKYNKKSLKPSDSTTPAGEEGTATPSGRVSGTTTPTNGAGTWRKGLKKGQTRADAIAQFKKRNPGQPLPAGWEPAPSGGSSERPSLAVTSGLVKSSTGSFRDPDGTGSGSAAVDKVKEVTSSAMSPSSLLLNMSMTLMISRRLPSKQHSQPMHTRIKTLDLFNWIYTMQHPTSSQS